MPYRLEFVGSSGFLRWSVSTTVTDVQALSREPGLLSAEPGAVFVVMVSEEVPAPDRDTRDALVGLMTTIGKRFPKVVMVIEGSGPIAEMKRLWSQAVTVLGGMRRSMHTRRSVAEALRQDLGLSEPELSRVEEKLRASSMLS